MGNCLELQKVYFFLWMIYSFELLVSAQNKLLSDILDIHDKNLHINFRLPSIQGGFMNSKTFIIKVLSNKEIIHFQKPVIDNLSTYLCWMTTVCTLGDYWVLKRELVFSSVLFLVNRWQKLPIETSQAKIVSFM